MKGSVIFQGTDRILSAQISCIITTGNICIYTRVHYVSEISLEGKQFCSVCVTGLLLFPQTMLAAFFD